MNGNGYEAYDFDLDDIGDYEYEDELAFLDDDGEARRRRPSRRRRRVPTGRGTGYYRRPASRSSVSDARFQAALAKISKDVKTNGAGIKSVNGRVDALSDAQKRQAASHKQEIAKLKDGVQMAALLPLISGKTVTVASGQSVGGTQVTEETKLQVAPSGISALLPLLLIGDGAGGGDSSNMLVLALALSGGI